MCLAIAEPGLEREAMQVPSKSTRGPGIREVAAAAGVSASTVSLVYNQKGRVAEETRELVKSTGRELGYRPNLLGKALQSGRSQVIGIVVSYQDSPVWSRTYLPYYRDIIAGAALEAVEHGYAIAAIPSSAEGTIETSVPLDGVVVVDPVEDDPLIHWSFNHYDAVVTDGSYKDKTHEPLSVRADMDEAIPQLLDHLQAERIKRHPADDERLQVALLVGARVDSYTADTISAYRRWCQVHGVRPRVEECGRDEEPEDAVVRLLEDDQVQAIHCLNETYCAAVVAAADRLGRRIPADLQISVRGDARAVNIEPRAAYLSVDSVQAGALSARLLIESLEGEDAVPCIIPFSIVPALDAG